MSQHRLIRAFRRQPVDRTPIWLMRQAGRYLPEYRALRQKAGGFLELAKNPELACEITLQPLQRFVLDGAIIFSDILMIPDAMGLELYFVENEGPCFKKMIQHETDVKNIRIPDPHEKLNFVLDAIKLTKKALDNKTPLIGFAGSPWTVATYMIDDAKKMLYQNPAILHALLDKLAQSTLLYLNAQIEAGADAVMIFDSWGGVLSALDYKNTSLFYIQKIIAGLKKTVPCILFTRNGSQWLEAMVETNCDVIGVDWAIELSDARKRVGEKVALQGNMDPVMLYTDPNKIQAEAARILKSFGKHPGHVFNLGHGVPKDVPVENVEALVNAVHALSPPYHG